MKHTLKYYLALSLIVLSASCKKEDENISGTCDQKVIISSKEYEEAPNDALTINSVNINGDCLTINISASGCSGESWEVKLISSEAILHSNPPQRIIRLSLHNEELCEAYITQEYTFDISETQLGGNAVIFNLQGYDKQIDYEY